MLAQADNHFSIPIYLDMVATFVFALTGAIGAIQRKYDYVGVIMVAILSGVGGSLLRDGFFLNRLPIAITDPRYIPVILMACVVGILVTRLRRGIQMMLVLIDAFGLGAYAMVGTQASLDAGIPFLGAALVGMLNGVGGSVLRDIIIREEPLVFRPSEHYAGAALAGIVVFLVLDAVQVPRFAAGACGIATTFAIRVASVYFGWRTKPVSALGWLERPRPGDGAKITEDSASG